MRFKDYKIDFPDVSFVLSVVLAISLLVSVMRLPETKLLLDKALSGVSGGSIQLLNNRAESEITEKYVQKRSKAGPSGRTVSTIVTLILWGAFGLVSYYVGFVFYLIFIKPFSELVKEEHYVHAEKKELIQKRALWCVSVIFTTLTCVGFVVVFRRVLLPYYVIFAHDLDSVALGLFVLGIFICSMLGAFIRLGARVIVRAY